ncbi:hypothetical protein SNE40_000858 [Patella caerulea]|uniref:Mutator-like transposase domain-containing protein n=1 Tax=Patella caerulea TaxID=87958 RepID=A0AAN8KKY0_PATCE
MHVYGDEHLISKQECINHVSKRMGTALRKLTKDSKKVGVTLGGRGHGRLTQNLINKLTLYYGKAIRDHANDLNGMRNAVFSSFLHAISTDSAPHHSRCPSGESSWCFYQKALALGETPGSHSVMVGTPLTIEVAQKLNLFIQVLAMRLYLDVVTQGKPRMQTKVYTIKFGVNAQRQTFTQIQQNSIKVSKYKSNFCP